MRNISISYECSFIKLNSNYTHFNSLHLLKTEIGTTPLFKLMIEMYAKRFCDVKTYHYTQIKMITFTH